MDVSLEWLKGGIFSDDTAVIVGDVEDKTPLDIYKEKLSPFSDDRKNYFREVCNKAEPRVRSLINAQLGMDFIPFTNSMEKHKWCRSYVAGKQGDEILVIRFISGAAFTHYKNGGELLDKHKTIAQHDIMVHGARLCRFVGYVFDKATKQIDPKYMIMIDVEKDREHLLKTWPQLLHFNHRVQNRIPPQMQGVDGAELKDILSDFVMSCDNNYLDIETYSETIKNKVFSFLGGGL